MGYYCDVDIKCPFCHEPIRIMMDFNHQVYGWMRAFTYDNCKCGMYIESFDIRLNLNDPKFKKGFEETYCGHSYDEMFKRWSNPSLRE